MAAQLSVSLDKIVHNTRQLCAAADRYGVAISGVSKGTWGCPDVAAAMLAGGVSGIAESRLENIARLREGGITCPLWLLRIPALSEADDVVAMADISLNSEPAVIAALSAAAVRQGKRHGIVLMVELGDLREGVLPGDLSAVITAMDNAPGVELVGLGTNLSCFGGVIPTPYNLGRLCAYAQQVAEQSGCSLRYISGGNSSSLPLLLKGELPAAINHLRLGESILLGRETVHGTALDGLYQDCFILTVELIEIKRKPSLPAGEIGLDSFGNVPVFTDRGERMRAIANIGRADMDITGLVPLEKEIAVIGGSSDHLLLDITDIEEKYKVGDSVRFAIGYSALLQAMRPGSCIHKNIVREDLPAIS